MSRIALLIPILIVLTFDPSYARRPVSPWDTAGFFALFLLIPLLGRVLAMRVCRLSTETAVHSASVRLSRLMGGARIALLLWTAAGLYVFGYSDLVARLSAGFPRSALLGVLLTCTPAYLAWLMTFWAQYPAERLLREQAMLAHLEADFPVRATPSVREFVIHHLRTGPGIFVMPVLLVLLVRDLSHVLMSLGGITPGLFAETLMYLASALAVFIISPLMLTRVLKTRRLPDGELRDRLLRLTRRSNVRCREVLLWDTGHTACNALVTGLFPRFRYVLLSDLLLESLHDEHIEAVFAHELGHIVHRHVAWYVGFLFSTVLLLHWVDVALAYSAARLNVHLSPELLGGGLALALTLLGFGLLSRTFERQADVFAARAMQPHPESDPGTPCPPLTTLVGERGATVFASALRRVAWVNNIPLEARNFTHGSIASRTRAILTLSADPASTPRFDTFHRRLRAVLGLLLLAALVTLAMM